MLNEFSVHVAFSFTVSTRMNGNFSYVEKNPLSEREQRKKGNSKNESSKTNDENTEMGSKMYQIFNNKKA